MGGTSSERDVSLASGLRIAEALRSRGHDVRAVDTAKGALSLADEQRLLGKRLDEIRSVRHRDFLLIFLSIAVGLISRAIALYFFHRRVIRRVRQLTENVRSLRDGSTLVHEPSDHGDDIGDLERELALIGDYLAERR